MRPPLRYAKTVDGGNVAYTVVGDGYPLLDISQFSWSNCVEEWETPGFSNYLGALSKQFQVIRFNTRGSVNSDPAPTGRKYREWIIDDIDAVLAAVKAEPVVLMAQTLYAQHIAEYAVLRPEAVSHLVFWNPAVRPIVISDLSRGRAAKAAIDDPKAMSDIVAQWALGHSEPEHMRAFARLVALNLPDRGWGPRCDERNAEIDLEPFYPRMHQPTLVVCKPPIDAAVPAASYEEQARDVATKVENAQLAKTDGGLGYSLDGAAHAKAIELVVGFVGATKPGTRPTIAASTVGDTPLVTARELEILALIAAGHSNAEIGEALVLSAATVSRHVANIYGKLGIHNRAQATAVYFGVANEGKDTT